MQWRKESSLGKGRRLWPAVLIGSAVVVALILARYQTSVEPADQRDGNDAVAEVSETNLSPELSRAVSYIEQQKIGSDQTSLLLLIYLDRKFNLGIDGASHVARLRTSMDGDSLPFLRLVDTTIRVEPVHLENRSRFGRLPLMALGCENMPLPDDFLSQVRELSNQGGYELTHAVLALDWAQDLGCLTETDAAELRAEQDRGLAALIAERGLRGDVTLEAMALLLDRGQGGLIEARWLEQLRELQRDDGGWGFGEESDVHATTLALWTLLESSRSEVAERPMVEQRRVR